MAASLNGIISFSNMTAPQITLAVVALVASVAGVVLAFLSETMVKLAEKAEQQRKAQAVLDAKE